jgi:hypothetical protein
MRSFYQDRLGTNIGKTPKRLPFSQVWDGCAEGQTGGVGVMQVIALVLPACAIALMSKKV